MKSDAQINEIRSHLRVSMSLVIAIGLFASALGATSPALEPQGVQAQWTFAEGTGTVAGDSSGKNVTGTLMNGAAWTVGRIGTAVSLDGANDYINLGANRSVISGVSQATLAAWIRVSAIPANGASKEIIGVSIAGASPTNSSRANLKVVGDGTFADVAAGGRSNDTEGWQGFTAASSNLKANTWYHVAAVLDYPADSIRLYVDGVLVGTGSVNFAAAATPNTPSAICAIGAEEMGNSGFFPGAIDEAMIYDHAVPGAQLAVLGKGDALQAHWKMDEGAGGTTADATANAYGGTLQNGLAWTTGQMVSGLSFDGVDDYVNLGSSLSMARNVNATTVTAWIKPGSTIPAGSYRELISLSVNNAGGPTNTSRIALALSGDGSGGDLFAGGRSTESEAQKNLTADVNLTPGAWAHVAGVIDFSGKKITLYLNGNQVATAAADFTDTHTPNTVSTNAALGAQDTGSGNFFHGAMDDVRVYSRPLCPCEIEFLALRDGLRARWPFDENTGTTTADASGNNVTGTLANGAAWGPGQVGTAVSLDGVNDHVSLGTNLNLLRKANAATLATWVKLSSLPANGAFRELISISVNSATAPTNMSRAALAVKGDGTGADLFAGGRSTDTESQQTLTGDANLAIDTWYHVAAVLDYGGNAIRIYLNGTLVVSSGASFSQPATPDTASSNAALGAQDSGNSNYFHGLLDDTRVYCRALSAAEIADLALVSPPPAPTNLEAIGGNTQVALTWNASAGATAYHVFRRLASESYSSTPITSVSTTNFTDMGLVNGTEYFYVVKAINAAGLSEASNEDSAIPNATGQVPAKPIIVTASQLTVDNTPTVVGTAEPNVAVTVLFTQGLTTIESIPTTADFLGNWSVTTSPKPDGAYTVRARATNATGDSLDSDPITITIDTTAPLITAPQPTNGSSTTNATPTISASWSDLSPASGINTASAVVRLDNVLVSATVNGTGFSFTPSSLALGSHAVTAQVQDFAGNASNLLTWSFSVVAAPTDTIPPVINNLVPANGSLTNDSTPQLSASIADSGGSGLKPSSILLTLNSVVVPATVTFQDPDNATITFTPSTPLGEGANAFFVNATDNNQPANAATQVASTFTVDTIPPVVVITNPASAVFPTPQIAVNASVSDSLTGLQNVSVQLNNVPVTSQLTLTPGPNNSFGAPGTITISGTLTAAFLDNVLVVTATDQAGNSAQLSRPFFVNNPTEPDQVLAISVVSGNGQSGLACRAAQNPLVVRVTDSASGAPVSGVQVDFSAEENGGSFALESPEDIVTDAGGLARVRYVFSSKPGANKVRASIAYTRTPHIPADFILNGQLPTIRNDTTISICNPLGGGTAEFRGSALPVLFTVTALHPDGSALVGELIRPRVLVNGVPVPNVGRFMPTKALANASGQAKFVFIVDQNAPFGGFTMRFALPRFRDANEQEVHFDVSGTVRPDSEKPRGFLDTEINYSPPTTSGQGQVGIPDRELDLPLRARLYGVTGGRIKFTVIEGEGSFVEGTEGTFLQYFELFPCAPGNIPMAIQTQEESSNTSIGNVKFTLRNGATHALIAMESFTDIFAVGPPELSIVSPNASGELVEMPGLHPVKLADATDDEAVQVLAKVPKGVTPTVELKSFNSLGNIVNSIPRSVATTTIASSTLGLQKSTALSTPNYDAFVSAAKVIPTSELLSLSGTPTGGGGIYTPISTTVFGGVEGKMTIPGAAPSSLKIEQVNFHAGEAFEKGRTPLIFYKKFPEAAEPTKIQFSFDLADRETVTQVMWDVGGDGGAPKLLLGATANKIVVQYVDGANADAAGTVAAPLQRKIDETVAANKRKDILVTATIDYKDALGVAKVGVKKEFNLRIALNAKQAPGHDEAPLAGQTGVNVISDWLGDAGQLKRFDGTKILPTHWEAGALTPEMIKSIAKTKHETRDDALTLGDLAAFRPTFNNTSGNFTLIKTSLFPGAPSTGVYGSVIGKEPFDYDFQAVQGVIEHEAQHVLFMANARAGQPSLFKDFLDDLNTKLNPETPAVIQRIAAFHEVTLYFDALNNPKFSYRFLNDSSPRVIGLGTGFEGHVVQYWNALNQSTVKGRRYTRTMEGEPWGRTFDPFLTIDGTIKAKLDTFLKAQYDEYLKKFPELEPYTEFRLPSATRLLP